LWGHVITASRVTFILSSLGQAIKGTRSVGSPLLLLLLPLLLVPLARCPAEEQGVDLFEGHIVQHRHLPLLLCQVLLPPAMLVTDVVQGVERRGAGKVVELVEPKHDHRQHTQPHGEG